MANGSRSRTFLRKQGQSTRRFFGKLPMVDPGATTLAMSANDAPGNPDASAAATLVPVQNADAHTGVVTPPPALPSDHIDSQGEIDGEFPDHPIADIIPCMSDEDLDGLTSDIRKNGLGEDIVLFEGKILDGRGRNRACKGAGVEPRYVDYTGSDPLGFVVSKNLHRRHLTDSQRTVAAAKASDLKLGANQHSEGMPIGIAAKLFDVSPRSVARVKAALRDGVPELIEAVESGQVAPSEAETISKLSKPKQRKAVVRSAKPGPRRKANKPNGKVPPPNVNSLIEAYKVEIKGFQQQLRQLQKELADARQASPPPAVADIKAVVEVGDLGLPPFLVRRELTAVEQQQADDLEQAWGKACVLVQDRFLAKHHRSLTTTTTAS